MSVTSYQNPILRGMYPDPSIVRVDDTFYMVNSTFEYYPGIALSKSKDLLNWTKLPSIATSPIQADLRQSKSNEGIFAVNIRYHDGYFYVITTNFAEFKSFVIRGQLTEDKENIIWEKNRINIDIMGIDPDLYFENGHTYVQFTGYIDDHGTKAIQQVEMNIENGSILRGPEVLSLGTGGRDVEGPHILKKKGYYYLLMAEGGTGLGHMVTMVRGKSIWGPFDEPANNNPLFTNRDRAEQPLQCIGHSDLFQDQTGNWWLVCLGTRPANVGFVNYTNIGRETLLYPVDWSTDWPVINHGVPTETVDMTQYPEHAKTLNKQVIRPFHDTFEEDELKPEWVTLRNHLGDRLTLNKGQLRLKGSDITLSDLSTPSFLGIRQSEQGERFCITLDPKSQINEGSFGIAIIINANHHCAMMIEAGNNGSYDVYKQVTVLDINVKEKIGTLSSLPSTLCLQNTKEYKIFTAFNATEKVEYKIHAMHFSNEAIAALNTGDIQGIYVLGNAEMIISEANRDI